MVDAQAEAKHSANEPVESQVDSIHFEETIATNDTMEEFLRTPEGHSSQMTGQTEAHFGFSVDPTAPDSTRYEVRQKIGEGAHGVVFKAHDRLLHRTLAIKQFNEMARAEYPTLASAETRIAAAVDHPGTPTIYDVLSNDDVGVQVAMEFVDGEPLNEVLARLRAGDPETHARYRFEQRVNIAVQVLRVLNKAHGRRIVHRDIKPQNIMVGTMGETYLMDWGIAIDLDTTDGAGILAGTPRYMSPEQARSDAVDHRSDIYSVGALLFELLTLKKHGPDAKSLPEFLQKISQFEMSMLEMSQPHPVHGGYPMEFRAVMMRALKRAPNERYQSACDMISALEDALSGDIKAECPSTFQFKIISKIRGLIIKKPTTGPLMIWAAFILGCASLIFIGTLL